MSSFLHRLRNKPEETRHRIAIGTSAGVTGLVFIMWITVLSYGGIMDAPTTEEAAVVNESSETTSSPLSSLRANAATAFTQLREGFESAATTSENIPEADEDQAVADPEETSTSERNFNNTSASYWEKQNNFPAATSVIDDASDNSDTGEKVPFTSLEYDPSQESEWLVR